MKAADWVLARPWAITAEALGVILAIAERENESPEAVEARLGRPLDNTREVAVRDGVAIIPVVGPISRYADFFSRISGATDIDTLAKDFRTALDDRSVKAVILNMDSPGGTVAGVAEFAGHVAQARGKGKPVVAYVGSQAASAGYWIASAADAIVADPTATLGSIGVVMGMRKPADAKAGQARTIEFVSSQSPHKRPDPETETGRAQIQATADELADVFVDAVAANRGVSRETVLADFGRGGVLVGARAVEAGLADRVGSLEPLIAELARGECPPRNTPKAPTRGKKPKEPAMSEPSNAPVAGETTISASELSELRRQAADAKEAREAKAAADTRAAEAMNEAIEARADSFVASAVGLATATEYARSLRQSFVLAARDDHDHPAAGSPTRRQDALRDLAKKQAPAPGPKLSSDPADRTRALASDPAGEEKPEPSAELDAFDARVRRYGKTLNGTK